MTLEPDPSDDRASLFVPAGETIAPSGGAVASPAELLRRNGELERALADAVGDRERYRALVKAATQMVWITDQDGQVIDMPFWRELTGQTVEEVRGTGWMDAIHPEDVARTLERWNTALATRGTYEAQFRLRLRDGSYRWYRARGVPVFDPDGSVREWVGLFNEIDRLIRRDEGMRFLAEASAALTESLDEQATLDALARLAVGNLADGAMITLVNEDGGFDHVTTRSRDGVTAAYAAETERMYPLAPNSLSGYPRAIRTAEPELVAESAFEEHILPRIAVDATHLERLRRLRMYSAMIIPLVARGNTLGAMTLVLHGPERRRAFDASDLSLATELGRRAALALDNARLFEAERRARTDAARSADRVQAVADASRAFAESSTRPTEVVDALARLLALRLGDMCAVRLVSADGEWLEPVAAHHPDPALDEELRELVFSTPMRVSEGITGPLVRGAPHVLIPYYDSSQFRAKVYDVWVQKRGMYSVLAVAMRNEGRVVGTVLLGRQTPDKPYDEQDLALVQDLADRAGLVLERARLFTAEQSARADAERAAELTRRLQEITASFARTITLPEVADTTLAQGIDALSAEAGLVYLMDRTGLALELIASRGVPEQVVAQFSRLGIEVTMPVTDAIRAGEILYLTDREQITARYPTARVGNRRVTSDSWVAIPLLHAGRVLGSIALGFPGSREFSFTERALVDALGRHCAQAMERARLLDAERDARDEAERANEAKSDLLAKVSHETRQPVHATIGWVDTMEMELHGPITDAQREALRRIKQNQLRLLSVLNDLLDIARIEAGHIDLALRDVAVASVVDAVEAAIAPQMRDKEIAFGFFHPDPSIKVRADEDQLVGILTNLLGNAAKFTPPHGEVEVTCEVTESQVLIRVRDTGIGIDATLVDRVFEPFFQVESGYSRTTMGTGLGLAISREAARAMGGDVLVTSVLGEGSCFTLRLVRAH
jgi:PAS domain S-box-containing protein